MIDLLMKTIILDAYNVIYRLPELSVKLKGSLQSARRALLNLTMDWKRERGFKGDIYIVYDGQDDVFNPEGSKFGSIRNIFTSSREEADDRIISMVRQAAKPSEVVVISLDGKVANGCKVYGANVENPDFLRRKRKKRKRIVEASSKELLSGKAEREINEYYASALGLD